MKLVIVESPAKARTIGRYLGGEYDVAASVGHVRDLPKKELGVDIEHGFEPKYETIRGKGKILKELKSKAKKAESIILATDPDREGEAIAYHVAHQLGFEEDRDRFERVTFREITKGAVEGALQSPEALDLNKVEAQQARRILDRLVGYQVSPFLWKPIRPGLSAGRVQTVALRLICEREDEINAFETVEYWSITARLEKDEQPFEARLYKIDGEDVALGNEAEAGAVVSAVENADFKATEVKRRERKRNPTAPFTTSTLQQDASKRLRFSARRTMSTAQRLYEGIELGGRGAVGLITYMRTDSTRVAPGAVDAARDWVSAEFGKEYLASSPRLWGGKQQKAAQDAHEAIRPADPTLHPDDVRPFLEDDTARLYELIWLSFVAGQMAPALYDTTTIDFDLAGEGGTREYRFRSTGSILKFQGFTRLYVEATEAGDRRPLADLEALPEMEEGDSALLKGIDPGQHFTQPPARFSEASLVKELEALGIGRPSTYAQIISTIQDRGYVDYEERRFQPTPLGDTVSKLLVRVFPNIFEVEFTSRMESELDRVEMGEINWRALLEEFYPPFQGQLERGEARSEEIIKEILAAEGEKCDLCGEAMQVRWNRFGRFLGCSAYPDCKGTRPIDGAPEDHVVGVDEASGQTVYAKVGPYGPYVQLGEAQDGEKPKRASLPKGTEPETVDLGHALRLLSLPRTVGTDPESGEEVVAGLGRYGPFVRRGKRFASLANGDQLFTVNIGEAVELLNQKKAGRTVLRELGAHPKTEVDVQILSGRYGPYVTDGTANASLPKGMDPSELTMEEAVPMLIAAAERKKAGRGRGKARK